MAASTVAPAALADAPVAVVPVVASEAPDVASNRVPHNTIAIAPIAFMATIGAIVVIESSLYGKTNVRTLLRVILIPLWGKKSDARQDGGHRLFYYRIIRLTNHLIVT